MGKKSLLLIGLSMLLMACSNANYEAGKIDDPYKILEAKREQYRKADEEKRLEAERKAEEAKKLEEENKVQATSVEGEKSAETVTTETVDEEKLRKEEAERVKNLPFEEKLQYRVNKAMDKVNQMVEVANKAREEEIANKAAIDEIETLLNPEVKENGGKVE